MPVGKPISELQLNYAFNVSTERFVGHNDALNATSYRWRRVVFTHIYDNYDLCGYYSRLNSTVQILNLCLVLRFGQIQPGLHLLRVRESACL